MLTRRRFLRTAAQAGAGLAIASAARPQEDPAGELGLKPLPQDGRVLVNDVHSQLNPTHVREITTPTDLGGLEAAVERAASEGRNISIAGGRHAMGGQQFGTDTVHLDTRSLNRIIALDAERGLVEVEAGITWPELVDGLLAAQTDASRQWSVIQKQTGADRLCVGGALSANAHGRGLT
jgi:FAD/FMN-containing dehydrogenase